MKRYTDGGSERKQMSQFNGWTERGTETAPAAGRITVSDDCRQ